MFTRTALAALLIVSSVAGAEPASQPSVQRTVRVSGGAWMLAVGDPRRSEIVRGMDVYAVPSSISGKLIAEDPEFVRLQKFAQEHSDAKAASALQSIASANAVSSSELSALLANVPESYARFVSKSYDNALIRASKTVGRTDIDGKYSGLIDCAKDRNDVKLLAIQWSSGLSLAGVYTTPDIDTYHVDFELPSR